MIINNLSFALHCAGIKHTLAVVENEYNKIQTIADVLAYNKCRNGLLWNWLPAIVYEKFGLDFYLSNFCNAPSGDSYVMLHPFFINKKKDLIFALQNMNWEITEIELLFSVTNISKIYGGFPWFESYMKLCDELNCLGKITSAFRVVSCKKISIDMINTIRIWKNENRDLLAPKIVKKYDDEKYPGIVNAFHSPNYIEQERFSLLLTE